jgi:uncharacterized protein (DUF111 family)
VSEYVDTPAMTIEHIGHGAGSKDFLEQPNLLRVFLGRAEGRKAPGEFADTVWILETNLDDLPGEIIGYCVEQLFAAGALDVWTTPIQMKKHRPGVILSVIATDPNLAALEAILFRETQTFGIRRHRAERSKLQRASITIDTPWGPVRCKRGWRDGQEPIVTPEFEDCARIARKENVPLREVMDSVKIQSTKSEERRAK